VLFRGETFSVDALHASGIEAFDRNTLDKLHHQSIDTVDALESVLTTLPDRASGLK
jgi:hypothetical protein